VAVLPVGADGALAPASSVLAHQGSGPNRERQQAPHAHGIVLDPAQRFALATDLGADRVFIHRFDAARGRLETHGQALLPPGSGPRHLAFDPAGRYVYVISELLSTLSAFRYDAAAGALQALGTVSTLPAGFAGESSTAEVAVSPDGRFVYGSNRGHDSLAVFRVASDGRLGLVGQVPAGGRTPRHFALDPSGHWLLVAHQDSNSITVFRLDPASGLPLATATSIAVSRPVCILFAAR
jgi:6-phosphogluconolactonase